MIKHLLPAAIVLLITGTARSQTPHSRPGIPYFPDSLSIHFKHFPFGDSLQERLEKDLFHEVPAAGAMRKGFKYDGNNGRSFEVFQTFHDNMYILRPDTSFSSNMPVISSPLSEDIRN
jgi:hypothetical protein